MKRKRGEFVDNIGGVIWVFIIIVSVIARISSKAKKQQQQQQYKDTQATPKKTTFQAQLNQVLDQISEIKATAVDQAKQSFDINGNARSTQSTGNANTVPAYRSSLEGDVVEGYQMEGYKMEGAKVEGTIMEGTKMEGLNPMHSTLKFSKDKKAYTESSMKSGFAGEGCDEHYDLNIEYTSPSTDKKALRQTLNFSDNPVIQGVVMAQILERPKR